MDSPGQGQASFSEPDRCPGLWRNHHDRPSGLRPVLTAGGRGRNEPHRASGVFDLRRRPATWTTRSMNWVGRSISGLRENSPGLVSVTTDIRSGRFGRLDKFLQSDP